jgi:hypothetical protein
MPTTEGIYNSMKLVNRVDHFTRRKGWEDVGLAVF